MAQTTDALKIIEKINRTNPQLQEMIVEASINAHVAQLIYEARIKAGLTQQQLAISSVRNRGAIARLEDAVTQGHSLSMLQKIARALNQKLEISLTSIK
jgi:ribosome-binding protein aMBF1 (putative translation factor)